MSDIYAELRKFYPCVHRNAARCELGVYTGRKSAGACIGCAKFSRAADASRAEPAGHVVTLDPSKAAKPQDLTCVHRGDVVDKVPCKSCGGNVMVKVFACTKHGRCQMGGTIAGVRSCVGCGDRRSAACGVCSHPNQSPATIAR